MRIVFMGTPDFAAAPLERIIACGKHQVICVITQPDKPKGRGKAMQFPPVKETALKYDIPVYQPEKVNTPDMIEVLKEAKPDCIVVAAFGQILKEEILTMPRYGCINIHASLLPKLRGAAPIQWAVVNGDQTAGVTTMWMDRGLDTGDMIMKKEITLAADETGGSLFDKLSLLGCDLILETLDALESGNYEKTPQTGESTYAKILTKNTGNIDWTEDAEKIECLIRGLNPWPSAFSYVNGKMVKFYAARVLEKTGEAGTVIDVNKKSFTIACGKGALEILELQLEGKKRMSTDAFLRGYNISKEMTFTCER